MINTPQVPRSIKHIGFWLVLYAVNLLFWGSSLKELEFAALVNLSFSIFRLPLSYFNIYVLIPRYVQERKFLHYLGWLVFLMLVHSIFFRYSVAYFWEPVLKISTDTDRLDALSIFSHMKQFLIEFYVQGIVVAVKLGQDWLRASHKASELEKKQVEMELGLLKTQLQPHFFFNTLNSLYALCLDQPKKAANSILGLSEVLDYILYKSGKTYVLLQHELAVVTKYIDLESLRFEKRLKIDQNIEEQAMNAIIPPLTLLTLVENCFKHGLHEVNGEALLNIDIKTHGKRGLHMVISNSCPPISTTPNHSGIGLKNLNRRLELLYDQFELNIQQDSGMFTVDLKLSVYAN